MPLQLKQKNSRKRHRETQPDEGFTLMEMVVAVFVVSVMMAVLMPHLLGAGTRAQTTACEMNERTIKAALTEYYMIYHVYPTGDTQEQLQTLRSSQFIESIPKEPAGGNYTISETDLNNVTVECSVHGILGNDS